MKTPIKSYRDLEVWKQAISLTKQIYQITATFPSDERFGLIIQMRRAAVSIASNIAEGHARGSTAEFQRFINIALGSAAELETQTFISAELGYISTEVQADVLKQSESISKMLRSLQRALAHRAKEQTDDE